MLVLFLSSKRREAKYLSVSMYYFASCERVFQGRKSNLLVVSIERFIGVSIISHPPSGCNKGF